MVYCLTFIVIGLYCGAVSESLAATAVVKWSRSPSSDVAGYVVYYSTQSRQYEYEEDCGDVTECELFFLDDQTTYYIAVRAYDQWEQLSDYSDEVEFISASGSDEEEFVGGSEVVVDNGEAGTSSTGTWRISSGANSYGSKSIYSKDRGATYTFEAALHGTCEVSLWWTERPSRSTSVPVEIYDGDTLLDTVLVNQKAQGGQWNVLGTYFFNDAARVTVVSEGTYSTCADAVQFNPISTKEVIVDNGEAGTLSTGTWWISSGANSYGSKSIYSKDWGATYTFEAALHGTYEVSLWWTERPSRSTSVPVEIYDGDTLLDTVLVNQKAQGGQWNVLGTYFFKDAAGVTVVSEDSSYSTCADAVRFVGF
ncbi:MAG: hypothetical protein U9R60_10015 [Bacteroidota bacterium]|nr:hypothetical protein [Bacteroidota bacterium]